MSYRVTATFPDDLHPPVTAREIVAAVTRVRKEAARHRRWRENLKKSIPSAAATVTNGKDTTPIMSKHTPGPWTIEEYGDGDLPALAIHKDSETRVCFMATPGSHGDPATIAADARLIAAAPDLLAALRACVNNLAPYGDEDAIESGSIGNCLRRARAAIAKARGTVA